MSRYIGRSLSCSFEQVVVQVLEPSCRPLRAGRRRGRPPPSRRPRRRCRCPSSPPRAVVRLVLGVARPSSLALSALSTCLVSASTRSVCFGYWFSIERDTDELHDQEDHEQHRESKSIARLRVFGSAMTRPSGSSTVGGGVRAAAGVDAVAAAAPFCSEPLPCCCRRLAAPRSRGLGRDARRSPARRHAGAVGDVVASSTSSPTMRACVVALPLHRVREHVPGPVELGAVAALSASRDPRRGTRP